MALACSTSIGVNKNIQQTPYIFYRSRDRIKGPTSVHWDRKHKQQCIRMIPSPVHLHTSMKRGLARSAHTDDGFGEEEDHSTATGVVHKLYTALKNRDLQELSEVIGDECKMVLNFMSLTHDFYGREQVLEFFSWLMSSMGKKIHFVIYPMVHSGPEVGVVWHLDWKESFFPLGKGYGLYTAHHYNGKIVIGDMKIFIEPFKHFGPLQSKLVEIFMPLVAKIPLKSKNKKKKALTYGLLSLLVFTISLLLIAT
ncbi:hypothetical protein H6P81_008051 [Aristolochia fimbriata]|uniref:Uncharacterized protein n=1 Tax=Aristolochia fimbriata TaxID=158543 RepID=A0AAV7F5T5_ARIFI|nr:hypothetical protein H6P81_008051 [Aristolochia fimbriata]